MEPRYERHHGEKYNPDLDVVEIAKRIRKEIRAAQDNGDLPTDMKVSVRTKRFSGGQSITATIKTLPDDLALQREATHHENAEWGVDLVHTERIDKVKDTIEEIMDAYNYDGSDPMTDYFDVRFYGHVKIDWRLEKARRDALDA